VQKSALLGEIVGAARAFRGLGENDRRGMSTSFVDTLNMKKSDAFSLTAIARANYARIYKALVTLLVFIAALGLGFILSRCISRPIDSVVAGIE
jgi:hypothetical protein